MRRVPHAGWLLCLLLVVLSGCSESRTPLPEEEATTATGSAATEPGSAAPAEAVQPGRLQDLSFDDVKFDIEKGDPFSADLLPPPIASLDGKRLRIRGYILPSFQQEGITQFVLVRDNMECCFGPGAALYDCIVVRMKPGLSTNFSVRPVAATGVFHVEELIGPDGRHLAIYSLEGEEVE